MIPVSFMINGRITTVKRTREKKDLKKAAEVSQMCEQVEATAKKQRELGLGDPVTAVHTFKSNSRKVTALAQVEALAEKFQAVKEPNEKFFPYFADGRRFSVQKLPELVRVRLGPGMQAIACTENKSGRSYQAPIPLIPPTALELASRAKACAPDSEFHLLFMPSWEPQPQRDPVLLVTLPGTGEWFEVAAWNGDVDLIKEFLENK